MGVKDAGQYYSPFNFWQIWELSLYKQSLYQFIANGTYSFGDPFGIDCKYANITSLSAKNSSAVTGRFNLICNVWVGDHSHLLPGFTDILIEESFVLVPTYNNNFINMELVSAEYNQGSSSFTLDSLQVQQNFMNKITQPITNAITNKVGVFGSTTNSTMGRGL